jgi:hypothetical protein
MTRGLGVCARGRREAYALTARNTLPWKKPACHRAMQPTGCSARHRFCGATGHHRRDRSRLIGRYKFHRPVVPDSVRGSSKDALKLQRVARGYSSASVPLQLNANTFGCLRSREGKKCRL